MRGKIKFYNHEKRYGFLRIDGGGEVFFHISGVSPNVDPATILKDVAVEFEVKQGQKGQQAHKVKLA